jgi:hypothetical protein
MMVHCRRAGSRPRGLWLFSTAAAACLALSAPGARAQGVTGNPTGSTTNPTSTPAVAPGATTTSVDIQTANSLLSMEQLAAQFYNANATKTYLTGVIATTPATGTPTSAVSPAGTPTGGSNPATGINQPGVNQGTINGTPFAATLSGGSASATASFLLSKDQTSVSYSITITGLSGPATAVRIRQGTSGSNMGIVLYELSLPVNGVSSGQFGIRPEDVPTLINRGMYLQITTAQNPNGELSGQIIPASGATAPVTPGVVVPAGSVFPASLSQGTLQSMVNEIRAGHNAHVTKLQQMLGTNAQPTVTFQNLDAPTLTQFLTKAQAIEDFAVRVALNGVVSVVPGTAATALPANPSPLLTIGAILADDARYAGAIRTYVKVVSTAEGGNPNTSLTETGQPFGAPATPAELNTFLQNYLVASANAGTGAGTTTGGTATGTTPSGGTAGTGTNPTHGPY